MVGKHVEYICSARQKDLPFKPLCEEVVSEEWHAFGMRRMARDHQNGSVVMGLLGSVINKPIMVLACCQLGCSA